MAATSSVVVLPGDVVPVSTVQRSIKLGPGLQQQQLNTPLNPANTNDAPIISTRGGLLKSDAAGKQWWVDTDSIRYIPSAHESVIGIITARHADGYRVDIGSAHPASLDALAFEGASKRNRPTLKVGGLVYARVSLAHKDMEPELECFDPQTHKSDGFGELKAGYLVSCSLGLARSLLSPTHPLLTTAGTLFPFEVAIGLNGRVWIKADDVARTVLLARAIERAAEGGGGALDDVRKWFAKELDKL